MKKMKNDFYKEWKKRPIEAIYIEDFYKELKKYPVENGMVQKAWIAEIFEKIKFKNLGMPIG